MSKKIRPRTERREKSRRLRKRIMKVQRIINTDVGLIVVRDNYGREMTPPALADMAAQCRLLLSRRGVDLTDLDVLPFQRGGQLQLRVEPKAPIVIGREMITEAEERLKAERNEQNPEAENATSTDRPPTSAPL